jgi:hypothetical protein
MRANREDQEMRSRNERYAVADIGSYIFTDIQLVATVGVFQIVDSYLPSLYLLSGSLILDQDMHHIS